MRMGSGLVVCAALAALCACEREQRRYDAPPYAPAGPAAVRLTPLLPGPPTSPITPPVQAASAAAAGDPSDHEGNAYAVSQGKRWYRWYNCNGCHGSGGGGMGPALTDAQWRYGHEPAQIVATILQGRPNGMPSFAGRISEDQAWQLAAYVRSMSGQLRTDVAPSRADSLSAGPPETRRDRQQPVGAPPPAPER